MISILHTDRSASQLAWWSMYVAQNHEVLLIETPGKHHMATLPGGCWITHISCCHLNWWQCASWTQQLQEHRERERDNIYIYYICVSVCFYSFCVSKRVRQSHPKVPSEHPGERHEDVDEKHGEHGRVKGNYNNHKTPYIYITTTHKTLQPMSIAKLQHMKSKMKQKPKKTQK